MIEIVMCLLSNPSDCKTIYLEPPPIEMRVGKVDSPYVLAVPLQEAGGGCEIHVVNIAATYLLEHDLEKTYMITRLTCAISKKI